MCCTAERGPVGARERRALVEIHQALEWAAPVRLSSAAPAGCAGGWELQPAPRLLPTHCKLGESCQAISSTACLLPRLIESGLS